MARALRPRDFLVRPASFGRFVNVEWREDLSQQERATALASRWQHAVAVATSEALQYRESTRDRLAREMGRERQYVWDRLQGRTWMSLVDLAFFEQALGVRAVSPDVEAHMGAGRDVEPHA